MIQWLLVLAFSFLTLNANAQMKELPADIDTSKLSYGNAKEATFECGAQLLNEVYAFNHCRGSQYACSGFTTDFSSIQEEPLDMNTVSSTVYFGFANRYSPRYQPENRNQRAHSGMNASQNLKLDSLLNLTYSETLVNHNGAIIKTVNANLVSEGTLPRLHFVTETVENCGIDERGKEVCEEPTKVFSHPQWIVQEGFERSMGWIDRMTQERVSKVSDLNSYMKCIEDQINSL